jgi:hypothetical protein
VTPCRWKDVFPFLTAGLPHVSSCKKLMFSVRVDEPDVKFGNMLLEQFGGANGELAAAMQHSIQGLNCEEPDRKDLLMDIGTEELSHLEVVTQSYYGVPDVPLDCPKFLNGFRRLIRIIPLLSQPSIRLQLLFFAPAELTGFSYSEGEQAAKDHNRDS